MSCYNLTLTMSFREMSDLWFQSMRFVQTTLIHSRLQKLSLSHTHTFACTHHQPGINVGHRSCLWNGLLAVAPGHPFLAKTIEIVVNNIRNRFTSVDYDDMLCPNPVLIVSHNVDMLFTCGPCILGAGMNDVLKRHMQHQFEIGEVDIWANERSETHSDRIVVEPDDPRLAIPGRSIILHQNKKDMGAHRFTWADRNIVVAATDMPDYDDRPPTKEHYSKTHEKEGIYGLQKLYRNNKRANEKIIIRVQP
mmetsp:Transcript_4318/g.6511  ORF Transcript_4318/g.6511 Transcript_4318/m.6511 type:complete len:250 (-) Transcript_4318:522-1271(-)